MNGLTPRLTSIGWSSELVRGGFSQDDKLGMNMHRLPIARPRRRCGARRPESPVRNFIDQKLDEADHPEIVARQTFGELTVCDFRTESLESTAIRPVIPVSGGPVLDDIEATWV